MSEAIAVVLILVVILGIYFLGLILGWLLAKYLATRKGEK